MLEKRLIDYKILVDLNQHNEVITIDNRSYFVILEPCENRATDGLFIVKNNGRLNISEKAVAFVVSGGVVDVHDGGTAIAYNKGKVIAYRAGRIFVYDDGYGISYGNGSVEPLLRHTKDQPLRHIKEVMQ